jgi:enoyl-CoA hydratase/carnithine racemase
MSAACGRRCARFGALAPRLLDRASRCRHVIHGRASLQDRMQMVEYAGGLPIRASTRTRRESIMNARSATAAKAAASSLILLREDMDGVAVLTLNQPQTRNTLSEAMLEALGDALTAIAHDENTRAVVLAANGPAFSAGHDLKELHSHRADDDGGRAYFKHVTSMCTTMMQQIVSLPQPVVAAVQATATAAGCQLVATCDLAVASSTAKFATSGINVGLFCLTPMVALARNLGRKPAMEMLLTGDMISAEDAARLGLVNRVVAPGTEREEAFKLAKKIADKSTFAIKLGKEAFYRQMQMSLADAYDYTAEVFVENLLARDADEGMGAFIEKRQPKWENR